MKTHTIRNKRGPTPILSLTPVFMGRVLSAQPEAIALTLDWFKRQYKALTGNGIVLDYEQTRVLNEYIGADESGSWTSRFSATKGVDYRVLSLFEQGFLMTPGMGLDEALEAADRFYHAMARAGSIPDFKPANA